MSTTAAHLPEGRRLKVAFVGTHGVGKTTLCFDLAAQLKRLDLFSLPDRAATTSAPRTA